jgi:D-ribulokinase
VSDAEDLWLGLDLGTQSARAVAVTEAGGVAAVGACPLASRRDDDRHEQDPEDWWDALAAAARRATAELPAHRIRGAAICATSGTVLLVDGRGRPLTPGVMYDDQRAAEEAERVDAAGAQLWRELGYARMPPSWGLPKLVRLLRGRAPGGGARLAHQADFVARRLAGEDVPADASHALKSGYDLLREAWPLDVMDALGVDPDVLPAVVRSGSRLGEVGRAGSAATGIPAGTPLVAGMTDGCAAQIGAGALRAGSWNAVLGTTLVVKGATPQLVRDPAGALYSHRAPDGGWLPGGASSTGAGSLAHHFPGRDLEALDRSAAAHEPASVLAYPLVSRGERFPFQAPAATGFVLGTPRDEGDLHAALLQGVAYVERLIFAAVDRLGAPTDGPLTVTGGGARSRYWCQVRADVLGRPVAVPAQAEAGFGMAVLAAAGVTARPLAERAAAMVRIREVIEPREGMSARFREPYVRFVGELRSRGWLPDALARHALERAGA